MPYRKTYGVGMNSEIRQSLQMGIPCALVALGYAVFMHVSMKGGPVAASITSVVGTLLFATLVWRWLVVRKGRYTWLRGGLIGLATGWFALYFGLLGGIVQVGIPSLMGDHITALEFLQAIFYAIPSTMLLFILYGWVILLISTIVGLFVVGMQKKQQLPEKTQRIE